MPRAAHRLCALQVCHTGGLRQLLPSFLPSFLFGSPSGAWPHRDTHVVGPSGLRPTWFASFARVSARAVLLCATAALVEICVDDHRHILYTRSQSSVLQVCGAGMACGCLRLLLAGRACGVRIHLIWLGWWLQVFDLGADGKAAPSKAAESSEFLHDAARAMGGRDVFGRGGALLACVAFASAVAFRHAGRTILSLELAERVCVWRPVCTALVQAATGRARQSSTWRPSRPASRTACTC